jgi:hypothetical protein
MSLQITKAKPNPAGKDRMRNLSPAIQLAGEWVDIKNNGTTGIKLDNVELYHWAYGVGGVGGEWKKVIGFTGVLGVSEVVRVHSGGPLPLTQMRDEDRIGANHHVFSGKNYVWNNNQCDFPSLWYTPSNQWLDQTEYDPFPGEGRILNRINKKLI